MGGVSRLFGPSLDLPGVDRSEDQMKAGMGAWLICSTICVLSLAYGQIALSAYFLAPSCALPHYVAKELERRRS